MIFDGEKNVYILSEQEYNEMFDGEVHANLELIKARNQIADLSKKVERLQEQLADASKTIDYYDKKDFHYTLADGTVMGKEPAHKYKLKWGVK